jgi:(p)ppGpp synthase/HD superfamily hydrolase
MDTVKMDLFADECFVFTPRGDVYDLPSNATPIDFAYRIHTDVGHRCIGARVNDRIVPLNTKLNNGDIVEIITSKTARPHLDWLNFTVTHSAKNRIRQWFKKHHREEHIQQGRQMLEAEIGRSQLDEFLKSDRVKEIGKKLNTVDSNDILAAVGYGDISVAQIVNRIREQQAEQDKDKSLKQLQALEQSENKPAKQSNIGSLGGLMHHLAKCCSPVPGEEIIGVVTRGNGIAVHRKDCTNLMKVSADRHMTVDWSSDRHTSYPAVLQVECLDRMGIAGDLLKKISDQKINIGDLKVEVHRETKTATIFLVLDVVDINQLNRIAQSLSQISDVLRVQRKDHRKKAPNPNQAQGQGQTQNQNQTKKSNVTPLRAKSPRVSPKPKQDK